MIWRSGFHISFVLSGILFILCACLLFSGVCAPDSWELLYVSDQLTMCEVHSGFSWIPFTLVATAAFQVGHILFLWHAHKHCYHHLSGTMHALIWHFVFSFACVAEFNAGADKVKSASQWWFLAEISENTLHQISAVQAIVDFFLIHVILFVVLTIDRSKYHLLNTTPLACYGALDLTYAIAAICFIILWLLNITRPATILEWGVLITAVTLQIIACERFNISLQDGEQIKRPFYSHFVVAAVALYIIFSVATILAIAPPGTRNRMHSTIGPVMHTGVAFWTINLVTAFGVAYSLQTYLFPTSSTHTQTLHTVIYQ